MGAHNCLLDVAVHENENKLALNPDYVVISSASLRICEQVQGRGIRVAGYEKVYTKHLNGRTPANTEVFTGGF